MTDEAKQSDDEQELSKKRQRELVDKLLAESPVVHAASAPLGGRDTAYSVTSQFIPVLPPSLAPNAGETQAAIFAIAYALKDSGTTRPVCFVFNGGPGSSSVWLHLGAVGPKRVRINEDGTMPAPPYRVVDNPDSWFEHFDLVFIDPPHTGYSLTASDDARKKMLSVDGDVEALAECIRGWLARSGRWSSPVFLAGESYGTTRGAALADKLQEQGVALAGIILVSCAMDLQSLVFVPRNDLPFALFLPGFASVAQYHGKLSGALGASPEAARAAAEAFVAQEYVGALHRGAKLDGKARLRIAKRIAELTGLPLAFVEEKNLRVAANDFFFELLRDEGRIVGRLDARVTGPMAASRTRQWEFDPGMEALVPPYTMAAQAYLGKLGLPAERRYEVFSMEVNKKWDWNRFEGSGEPGRGNHFTTTSTDLARALRRNPHLRVLVASGYYDLGTPYSATDWSLSQLDAPPEVLARIEHRYYDGGHMMYTREADLKKLKADLAQWLALMPLS
ncbi:MAG: peptidase S10 [Betaproteobacteria bacterium]